MKSEMQQAISDMQFLIMTLHWSNRLRTIRLIRDRRRKRMRNLHLIREYFKYKQEMTNEGNNGAAADNEQPMDVEEQNSSMGNSA